MNENDQIVAAKKFSSDWIGRGDEDSDYQDFWRELIKDVFGVETKNFFLFNRSVKVKNRKKKYDIVIPSTRVLIEQKSFGIDLDKRSFQSDGANLTPFEQAMRYVKGYNDAHEYSEYIQWVVTCNFDEFRIYDVRDEYRVFQNLEEKSPLVMTIKLEMLYNNLKYLKFLVDPNDEEHKHEIKISKSAANITRQIHDIFEKDYAQEHVDKYAEFLNILCIRLVFLFYADDAAILNASFAEYLQKHKFRRETLQDLFNVLNLNENLRDDNLSAELNGFKYVNGGLFSEKIYIPQLDKNIDFLIERATITELGFYDFKKFGWKLISPTIFGSMFESILNPETRRQGGMHYTSVENIHKVIDPLFLDELYAEFNHAKKAHKKNRPALLRRLRDKLSTLTFFDPACGSGNFLTETYLSLRKLENEILKELHNGGIDIFDAQVKVSIHQFFGIEINGYAAAIAQLAIYIAENQMLQRTEAITGKITPGLPLSTYNQIHCANALQVDWSHIAPRGKISFIFGNPPFVGYTYQSAQQKKDLLAATGLNFKKMDYVVSWYYKAAAFIQGTDTRCAFVSTNSICQGEQVAAVWKNIFAQGIHFDFAWRTFQWSSESAKMAAVHCVIIGFSQNFRGAPVIYDGEEKIPARNINPYLIDGENVFIESRTTPICNVPKMTTGNRPADGGNLIIEADDYDFFTSMEPAAEKYIRRLIGAEEFINGKKRYCLWLVGLSLEEILKMPLVADRVEKCFWDRMNGAADRQKLANTPHLFRETFNPENYILVPETSSENRRYIPIGFLHGDSIPTNATHIIPDATVYHFGVLISSVHMAWTRAVCGRLEKRYRYSKDIVYNNFIWCTPNDRQRREIERTAQKILDVLAEYPDWTLAKLYDEQKMPANLRAAHKENDAAVLSAYGFSENLSEAEIVAKMFELYQSAGGGNLALTKNEYLPMTTTAREVLQTIRRWKYYAFGILTSSVHMAWTRTICGRLKSDYRYSKDIVYNNFPWCSATNAQREQIELAAEKILRVRAEFPGKTLAWLYDAETMPEELRLAHAENDAAVLAAYGFGEHLSEPEIVAQLLKMYQALAN